MNRPMWSKRRKLVIAAVLVLVVALLASIAFVGLVPGSKRAAAPSPIAAQAAQLTVPQLILARHSDRDGLLDFEGTLEMFSYAFEALPGVTVPAGPAGDPSRWADLAMQSILPHVAELTDAQRKIVASFLVGVQPSAGRPGALVGAHFAAYFAAADPSKVELGIDSYVHLALDAEAKKLGHSISDAPVGAGPGSIRIVLVSAEVAAKMAPGAPAWTVVSHGPVVVDSSGELHFDATGNATTCTIFFGPGAWDTADGSGAWAPDELQVAEVYHEVFHCYQGFVIGSKTAAAMYATPNWVKEGGADWAASSATGFDEPEWKTYLSTPGKPLIERAYDAVGLFFEMEYVGGPLWPDWWQIWSAAANGGWGNTDWFNGIAGNRLDALRQAWGASYFQNAGLGHDWTETVTGQTTKAWATPMTFTGQLNGFTAPYSTLQVNIPPQADGTIVVATVFSASGRWIDHSLQEQVDTKNVRLCWGGTNACTCPNGGPAVEPTVAVTGGVSWAMTSLQDVGNSVLTKYTRDEYCKTPTKDLQPPPPPPCQAGCAGSNGDPHQHSVNGRRYDFQAAGEFTLIRSANGSVEVQARQEPLAGSSGRGMTINTAVAVGAGEHRVGVYVGSSGLETHVDGAPVTATAPIALDGGLKVSIHPNGVEIDLPDGSTVWALPVGRFGINVQLAPSADLAGTGLGLLGAIAPGFELPKLPDGSALAYQAARTPAARYDYLYGAFAKAWRVTDQTSLFDYANGKTTASYDVPGFVPEGGPQKPFTLDPSQRAAAEGSCGSIADVELRNDCVFDVTVSQDTGFVAGYQNTATFQSTGVSVLGGGTPTPGKSALPSQAPATSPTASPSALGQLQISRLGDQVTLVRGTAISPAGIVYVMAQEPDRTEILRIDPTGTEASADISIVPPTTVLDGLAFAGDSVWLVQRSGTDVCSVDQEMRGPTAATGAPIALDACPDASPAIVATSNAIWVQAGPSGGSSHLLRIDPVTGTVTGSVALPQGSHGALAASTTTAFWTSSAGLFRLNPATNSAELLGPAATSSVPSGSGIWVQRDSATAALLGDPGSAHSTVAINGTLVGANATDLFVARPSPQGGEELWRYPVDGSAGVLLAPAASDTGVIPAWAVSATAHAPMLVGDHFVIQAIAQSPGSPQPLALQLEVVPIK